MKQSRGFTIIELLVVLVVLAVGAWLFYNEKSTANAIQRDSARKIAINAMYYNLEEVYYPEHHYYPASISSPVLHAMDPGLFTDPRGNKLGSANSDYHYEGQGCTTDGKCSGYTLKSTMEREADYVKQNRNNKN